MWFWSRHWWSLRSWTDLLCHLSLVLGLRTISHSVKACDLGLARSRLAWIGPGKYLKRQVTYTNYYHVISTEEGSGWVPTWLTLVSRLALIAESKDLWAASFKESNLWCQLSNRNAYFSRRLSPTSQEPETPSPSQCRFLSVIIVASQYLVVLVTIVPP